MPRSFSISMKSDAVARCSAFCRTAPACWRAPPYSRSFSVMVVLPESGWEMMARFRLRSISTCGALKSGVASAEAAAKRDGALALLCSSGWKARVVGASSKLQQRSSFILPLQFRRYPFSIPVAYLYADCLTHVRGLLHARMRTYFASRRTTIRHVRLFFWPHGAQVKRKMTAMTALAVRRRGACYCSCHPHI